MQMHRIYIGLPSGWRFSSATAAAAATLTSLGIAGATIFQATGLWEGNVENTLVVEVIGCEVLTIDLFAVKMRDWLQQDAVLVVTIPAESGLK